MKLHLVLPHLDDYDNILLYSLVLVFSENVFGLLKVQDVVGEVSVDTSERQQKLLHISLPLCQESQAEAGGVGGGRRGGCRRRPMGRFYP